MFFRKKTEKRSYDPEKYRLAIRASICTGERVAGLRDIHTGQFQEVMLLISREDLDEFRKMYDVQGEIETFY